MAISLYDATVPQFIQILQSVAKLVAKAEAYCAETGTDPAEIIGARIHEDMLPFAYQVRSSAYHSAGAIAGLRAGVFTPNYNPPPQDFAGLHAAVQDALSELEQVTAEELDALADRDMRFEAGELRISFTGYKFLLSFSQPNFYFHSSTAYDILRMRGLDLGKRDYLGKLQRVV